MTQIDSLKKEQAELEGKLAVAKKNARQLPGLKKKMAAAESRYRAVMKALPEKEEIPSLLTSVSQSGSEAGLQFQLFQPGGEVNKQFYAEIPVSIKLAGGYHNIAEFFDRVAALSRIVTIKNISISPTANNQLNTSCSAVTYTFIEQKGS